MNSPAVNASGSVSPGRSRLNPRLIVADEPVSALDVSIQSQILNMMKALQQTHRLTYIVISHDLAVLRFLSDRIGVMYLGKLVEIGASKEIYEQPAHPYTRGLIDTIPVPDPVLAASRRGHHISGELPSAITPPSGCRFRTRCPQAQDLCAAEEPPIQSFGGDHMAACHFPLQQPVAGRRWPPALDGGPARRRALPGRAASRPGHRATRSTTLQPHLERVPQRVADVVERDRDEDDADARRVDEPPGTLLGVGDAVGEHLAPARTGGRHAEAEEAERGRAGRWRPRSGTSRSR